MNTTRNTIGKTVGLTNKDKRRRIDGRKFKKSDEIREDFLSTEAYSEIYMELATNSEEASRFVNSVLPADLAAQANELIAKGEIDEDTKQLLDTLKTE